VCIWKNSKNCLEVRNMQIIRTLLYMHLLCLSSGAWADVPVEQEAEVEHLIGYLQESGCQMVRNGKSYNGEDGANHVRRKYNHFRKKISSTEAFIEYSATKSMMSGKYYQVDCPGEEPMRSQDWLLKELQAHRGNQQRVVVASTIPLLRRN